MYYNIVALRNRWKSSGLLTNLTSVKQEVELSRYLDVVVDKVLATDDDFPDKAGDFVINAMVEIYEILTVRKFVPVEVEIKNLSDNLRIDEHKIDIDTLIDITIEVIEAKYINKNDYFKQETLDIVLRDEIILSYLRKHGTRE
jgi:hypothetical protein